MARVFISHSSLDNAYAIALRDWLVAGGWDDLFLDLDPERGIAAGERWERALHEAANRCEAVLFMVSRNWLESGWCLKEYRLASKLNKRMFGLLIDELTIPDLPAEFRRDWQIVDLASGVDHVMARATLPNGGEEHVTFSQSGLTRLRVGLTRAGLDPKFFAWPPSKDPDRAPYPGLKPLDQDDAGIFFGREASTIAVLDQLRGLREAAAPRVLAILGASGAGKSSFLRAGLLPRLARDDRNFAPLQPIRPERAALSGPTGLIACLASAFASAKLGITRAQIEAAVSAGAPEIAPMLAHYAAARQVPLMPGETPAAPPSLVLSIDQGEELFLAEGAKEAKAFLGLLRDLSAAASVNLILLVSIRSDAYERLQSAPELDGVQLNTFSLPPLPRGAFETVIEGPARRLAGTKRPLTIEPALTEALLTDIESGGAKDALPLLAFTLEKLYADPAAQGNLTFAKYKEMGGVKGSIEKAVKQALKRADDDSRVPKDPDARLALLRAALIPWLAGIDFETGAPRRRVARLVDIPEECRPLVEHLVEMRLLSTDTSQGDVTVEPAHEALLRQWGSLKGWLDKDFPFLAALDGVKRAARDWEANERDPGWLSHAAGRLDDTEKCSERPDLRAYLDTQDLAYLRACRAAETARRDHALDEARRREADATRIAEQQRKIARRTRLGLIAAIVLALTAGGAAFIAVDKAREAEAERDKAQSNYRLARQTVNDVIFDFVQGFQALEGVPGKVISRVLGRARSALDTLAAGAPDDLDLQRLRAAQLIAFGDVLTQAGDAPAALAAYEEGLAIRRRLAALDPNNTQWQRDVSVSLDRIGDLKARAGDAPAALAAYEEGLAIARRLAALDPNNTQWQRDVSVSLNKIGDLKARAGDAPAALAACEEGLAIARRLAALDPNNTQWQRDVLGLLTGCAYSALLLARHDDALRLSGEAVQLEPKDLPALTNYAHALMFLERTSEARSIYLANRREKVSASQSWEGAILGDFAAFRKAGLPEPPLMAEIEAAFGAPPQPASP
jgi:tetratricopeptide (TPR) repeat protein